MTVDKAEQLVAHHLAYSFLSKAFYEAPDAEFIDVLAQERLFDEWVLGSDNDASRAGLNLLRSFCEQWDGSQLDALKQDYARLFIGPTALLAPPWESVYRSAEHLIFERQTLEVRQEYQRFGMPIPNLHVEPDDHIGLELRFISYLCSMGISALEQDNAGLLAQVEEEIHFFLRTHLLKWADSCLTRVIEQAHTDFYRGVAYLAQGCLAQSAATFGRQPQEAAR
jgi:TorA maturation chaperone TorD